MDHCKGFKYDQHFWDQYKWSRMHARVDRILLYNKIHLLNSRRIFNHMYSLKTDFVKIYKNNNMQEIILSGIKKSFHRSLSNY